MTAYCLLPIAYCLYPAQLQLATGSSPWRRLSSVKSCSESSSPLVVSDRVTTAAALITAALSARSALAPDAVMKASVEEKASPAPAVPWTLTLRIGQKCTP